MQSDIHLYLAFLALKEDSRGHCKNTASLSIEVSLYPVEAFLTLPRGFRKTRCTTISQIGSSNAGKEADTPKDQRVHRVPFKYLLVGYTETNTCLDTNRGLILVSSFQSPWLEESCFPYGFISSVPEDYDKACVVQDSSVVCSLSHSRTNQREPY